MQIVVLRVADGSGENVQTGKVSARTRALQGRGGKVRSCIWTTFHPPWLHSYS